MSRRALKERIITVPHVKEILESIGEEHLDQFQRRSLDYAAKFSKIDADKAEKLSSRLIKEFELEEDEAIQIVNCMPESIEEIRPFLAGGHRIMKTSRLEAILNLLNEYRKKE